MKKIVITGATSGIGLATAKEIALLGHHLILACRNMEKAQKVKKDLESVISKIKIDILKVDLANFSSIIEFSSKMNEQYESIDVLINNAGVFSERKNKTKDGYELTIGTNFLGQVLLTKLLLPLIQKAEKGRIVNVSSEAALFGKLKITEDLFTKPSKGFIAYSKSKLAQILYNIDLSQELQDSDVSVNAVHPGHVATNIWYGDSVLMKVLGPLNRKIALSPEQGATICVEVALSKEYENITGKFYKAGSEMTYNKRCLDNEMRNKLMKMTNEIVETAIKNHVFS